MGRITRYASLPSTSDVILERIRSGVARAGDVVVAEAQTAGRGRLGRSWISETGGLWLTAALPAGAAPPPGQMALVAGIAACEAAREWVPEAGVKWPNDLVVHGRKAGGILVEWPAEATLAAVGIGINVSGCPAAPLPSQGRGGGGRYAACLAQFAQRPVMPDSLLPVLLEALERRWEEWLSGGWPALRDTWREMDAARGRPVRLEPPGIEGRAEGIDDDGLLRIRRPDGRLSVATVGEVTFLE